MEVGDEVLDHVDNELAEDEDVDVEEYESWSAEPKLEKLPDAVLVALAVADSLEVDEEELDVEGVCMIEAVGELLLDEVDEDVVEKDAGAM